MFEKNVLGQQCILITGGASGIGLTLSKRCAELGAKVIIASRNEERLAIVSDKLGDLVSYEVLDLRGEKVPDQIQSLYKRHHITSLINNAAANFLCPSEHLSINGYQAIVDTVMKGTFIVTQSLAKEWLALGVNGQVVSIGVPYAQYAGPYMAASAMAKAALEAMTRSLSIEWANRGVRLNTVIPGYIETEGAWSRLVPPTVSNDYIEQHIPTGQLSSADAVSDAVIFSLLQPSMRGQSIMLDDGATLAYGAGMFLKAAQSMSDEDWVKMKLAAKKQDH